MSSSLLKQSFEILFIKVSKTLIQLSRNLLSSRADRLRQVPYQVLSKSAWERDSPVPGLGEGRVLNTQGGASASGKVSKSQ